MWELKSYIDFRNLGKWLLSYFTYLSIINVTFYLLTELTNFWLAWSRIQVFHFSFKLVMLTIAGKEMSLFVKLRPHLVLFSLLILNVLLYQYYSQQPSETPDQKDVARRRLPDVLIMGVKKSGTITLGGICSVETNSTYLSKLDDQWLRVI